MSNNNDTSGSRPVSSAPNPKETPNPIHSPGKWHPSYHFLLAKLTDGELHLLCYLIALERRSKKRNQWFFVKEDTVRENLFYDYGKQRMLIKSLIKKDLISTRREEGKRWILINWKVLTKLHKECSNREVDELKEYWRTRKQRRNTSKNSREEIPDEFLQIFED